MGSRYATSLQIQASELDSLLGDPRPLLLAFEAEECGPCDVLAPRLDELARDMGPRAVVVRVRGAADASFAARHHLVWLPTIAFWHKGRERLRLTGAAPIEALRAHLLYVLEGGPLPAVVSGPRRAVHATFNRDTMPGAR
jgi:thioredoxin-like negative regulator of GroEL